MARTPRTTKPKPKGRPSAIHREVHLPNGTTTTVAHRIIDLMQNGCYAERAAREAGVRTSTFYDWLSVATATREKLARLPKYQPTDHEQACVDLSDAVGEAEARYEMTALTALERIGHGLVTLEVVTEKYDAKGELTERTVKTTGLPPNPHTIMWKLTRRFPERYQLTPNLGAATPPPPDSGPVEVTSAAGEQLLVEIEEFVRDFTV